MLNSLACNWQTYFLRHTERERHGGSDGGREGGGEGEGRGGGGEGD